MAWNEIYISQALEAHWDVVEDDPGWVYAIADLAPGLRAGTPFKIGWARDPEKRLRILQMGNPRVLSVVDRMQGDRRLEAAMHALWSPLGELPFDWLRDLVKGQHAPWVDEDEPAAWG